jgi:FPC/CPF motif-containing protein YcgG
LQKTFYSILNETARKYDIKFEEELLNKKFEELIIKLNKKFKLQTVVLIDEYDKPILDNITDKATAQQIRDELKNYYAVLKDTDQYLKFVFITGVSKFSKVSLFS